MEKQQTFVYFYRTSAGSLTIIASGAILIENEAISKLCFEIGSNLKKEINYVSDDSEWTFGQCDPPDCGRTFQKIGFCPS
jgi:hypothetical protein